MVFKVKSLDDKVKEYRLTFGKHKDKLLEDVDVDYIDWALKNYDRLTDWDKKVMNRYIHTRAVEINEQLTKDRDVDKDVWEDNFSGWVDENF